MRAAARLISQTISVWVLGRQVEKREMIAQAVQAAVVRGLEPCNSRRGS